MNIPALLILKSLENEDKDICRLFYPEMFDQINASATLVTEMKKVYAKLRRRYGRYELYNLMEKCLIEVKLTPVEQQLFNVLDLEKVLLRDIRGLAMQLSRNHPADWNKFLDVVIK